MNRNSNTFFEKTPPVKLFFLAAIPGGISMLAASLYGLIDGVFVGRMLGEVAFAALNLAFPFVIINFSLADLIGVGSSVPISIHLGKKEDDEANNVFTCACIMIVLTGIFIGGVLFFFAPALIRLLGAEGELAKLAVQYMSVYALSSPFTTIVFAMDNYLRICGKVRTSMNLNIIMSVLSVVFDVIFLCVFHLGIWSTALAACLGMFICAVIALRTFLRGDLQLKFCKPRFHLAMIRQIIACGSPNFLSNIAGRITSVVLNIVLLRFGGADAVSIYGVLMYTAETIQSFLYGVCDSLQPAVGYNWGAGRKDRVKAIEKCCFSASAVISLVSAVVMFMFPAQITSLFVKNAGDAFMGMAVFAMRLYSTVFITRWFSFAAQSFVTAIEKPKYATMLSVSTAFIFPLVLIVVLWPLGLNGIWINFPVTYTLAAVLAAVILLKVKKEWKKA